MHYARSAMTFSIGALISTLFLVGELKAQNTSEADDLIPEEQALLTDEEEKRPMEDFESDYHKGTLSLIIENDVFTGTDRNYTNGIQIAYFANADEIPLWTIPVAKYMPFLDSTQQIRTGIFFGHEIYTPSDTDVEELLPDQRPYAGWLHGGLSLSTSTRHMFSVWRLDLGIVGPDARGKEIQNGFHSIIDEEDSLGWDNQIDNMFGYNLLFEHGWRNKPFNGEQVLGISTDIITNAGFNLGNIGRYISSGITFRVGNDLESDFGPPRIRPALPGSAFFTEKDSFGWYIFGGVGLRYVDKNLFVDGNNRSDEFTIEKKDWVADAQFGGVLSYKRVRLTYTYIYRTKEYKTQDFDDKFGSLGISFKL